MTRAPRAYRIVRSEGEDGVASQEPGIIVTQEPETFIEAADGAAVPMGEGRSAPWGAILVSAMGALMTLGLALWVERLVVDLFRTTPWLGWTALGIAGLALLAFLAIVIREAVGIMRERAIERMREDAADVLARRDHPGASRIAGDLVTLYRRRPETARGRARIEAVAGEILDAEDRLVIVERELLAPLDERAKRIVADGARQVSLVTAVSPRALVDIAFVIFAATRLLRRLSALYGGRPGFFGLMRLARAAVGHLAVTGGVAVGDGLVQQALGQGLAARLSARLGEGVLNGIMTARFGLAAIAVCRPLPFVGLEPPRFGDVAGELLPSRSEEPSGPI